MPHVIIIAGPNGAGKSTAAPALLNDTLNVTDFVNADTIAQGLCAFEPEKEAIRAARIMLNRIHSLAVSGKNFSFETTLASRSFSQWLPRLKRQGYQIHLIYLWLKDVNLALSRVKERMKIGGHFVPEATIRRRYNAGIKNFFNLYCPILDCWQFYDNSNVDNLSLIASSIGDNLNVNNEFIWKQLKENYSV